MFKSKLHSVFYIFLDFLHFGQCICLGTQQNAFIGRDDDSLSNRGIFSVLTYSSEKAKALGTKTPIRTTLSIIYEGGLYLKNNLRYLGGTSK